MNWQFLIGHPVSSAAASNQSIHSIHPVHHHSRHHQVIHNDVVDDDEVLIIKFHSPFIISIYEPLSRIMEKAREELSAVVSPVLVKCTNNASFTNENSLFTDLRGGVKLEFFRNLFDSIRKFAIRLI